MFVEFRSTLVMVALLVFCTNLDASHNERAKSKLSPARLKGMKVAIADLEKGVLKQKEYPPLPYPPRYPVFIRLLESECGLEWEVIRSPRDSKQLREEIGGYNDIMRAEIEHRFGREIFAKLQKRAGVVRAPAHEAGVDPPNN